MNSIIWSTIIISFLSGPNWVKQTANELTSLYFFKSLFENIEENEKKKQVCWVELFLFLSCEKFRSNFQWRGCAKNALGYKDYKDL